MNTKTLEINQHDVATLSKLIGELEEVAAQWHVELAPVLTKRTVTRREFYEVQKVATRLKEIATSFATSTKVARTQGFIRANSELP